MFFVYQIAIRLFYLAILAAYPFSDRARQWISGRRRNKPLFSTLTAGKKGRTLWIHVSSLGEFEQGRPVLERWKATCPDDKILLSFFSPSGFNIRKNYPLADVVFYLPLDTTGNMNRLIDQIKPDIFILVKYDFWPNLLRALHQHKIPSFLISARFRPEKYLFKWWGRVFLRQLRIFKQIFVQDGSSLELLKEHHIRRVVVAGDTRVDAVMKRDFKTEDGKTGGRKSSGMSRERLDDRHILIGGSTWPVEEKMLARLWKSQDFNDLKKEWGLVIAPHDISEDHLAALERLFSGEVVRLSRIEGAWADAVRAGSIVLVDSIGLLASLYAYADIAFIGGGFGKGIHSILEPAAFGIPVVFGPKWRGFGEAVSMTDIGAAFPVNDFESFSATMKKLCSDSKIRVESGNLAVSYMKSQMGSTDLIIRYLLGKW